MKVDIQIVTVDVKSGPKQHLLTVWFDGRKYNSHLFVGDYTNEQLDQIESAFQKACEALVAYNDSLHRPLQGAPQATVVRDDPLPK